MRYVSGYLTILGSYLALAFGSLVARRTWLADAGVAHVAAPGAACARCHRDAGAVSLLTSAAVYYRCDHCHHRWSEAAMRQSRVA